MINWIRKNRILIIALTLGLLIRLALMPSTLYVDLLSSTLRQYLFIDEGRNILTMFPEYFLSGYLWMIKGLVPQIGEVINILRQNGVDQIFTNSTHSYNLFLNYSTLSYEAPRYIFLLKFPFLILDLLLLYFVILYFKEENKNKMIASFIWALNPFLLYGVYIWGRSEGFVILFSFLVFYFAKNKKDLWSFFFLGLSFICRDVFVLLLPLFWVYFYSSKNKIRTLLQAFIFAVPWGLYKGMELLFPNNISSDLSVQNIRMSYSYDFVSSFTLGREFTLVSVFVVALLLIYYFYLRKKMNYIDLIEGSLSLLLALILLSKIHPHYFVWITAPMLIYLVYMKKYIYYFAFIALFFLLFIDAYFGPIWSLAMLRPVNFEVFSNLDSISRIFFLYQYDIENIKLFFHTVYVALGSLVVIKMYYEKD